MIDFFKFSDYEEANIIELKRVIVFTSVGDTKILFRQYEAKDVNETDVKPKKVYLVEVGPHFDLTLRRDQIASSDLYKNAMRQPKVENPEIKKYKKN